MSTLQERIGLAFVTLDELVTKAESMKEETQAVREFATKVNGFTKFVASMNGDGYKVLEAIGDELTPVWVDAFEKLTAIGAQVSAASGLDRSAGDESVNALQALAGAPLFAFDDDPDAKAKAEDLLSRWQASAPTKGTRSEGSGSAPADLGYTVAVKCTDHGCNWSARTSKDNWNSLWNQAMKHLRETHKVVAFSAKDNPEIVSAIKEVIGGEINAKDTAKFQVSRTA